MDRIDQTTPAPARKPKQRRSRWSPDEHNRFLDAISMFGRDWKKIEAHVGTRTAIQLRSHAQKYFEKAQKLGVTGLPPPRPKRKRKNSMPVPPQQQPQGSSSAGQTQCAPPPTPPEIQSSGCASILGRSTSASPTACLKNHGGVGTDQAPADEPAAATYSGDNSFMGTPSFFSEMSMALEWAGSSTGSTSLASAAVAPPPSSLPEVETMLPGHEAAMDPWDIIMQEIKDIGLAIDMDMDMTIPTSIIPAGRSECGSPPPHHGVSGDCCDTDLPSPYV